MKTTKETLRRVDSFEKDTASFLIRIDKIYLLYSQPTVKMGRGVVLTDVGAGALVGTRQGGALGVGQGRQSGKQLKVSSSEIGSTSTGGEVQGFNG